jgi:hypothetical protein
MKYAIYTAEAMDKSVLSSNINGNQMMRHMDTL